MKKQSEKSLTSLIDAALKQAAKKAIERAKQTGTPVIARESGSPTNVEPQDEPSKSPGRQKRTE